MNQLIAPIGVIVLIVGSIFLVGMPRMSRLAPWMGELFGARSDAELIAVRAAWQRMGLASGIVLVVLAIALFVSDLDLYLAPVGYVLALIAGAAATVGGGTRRRAQLLSMRVDQFGMTRALKGSFVLGLATIVLAIFGISNLAAHSMTLSSPISLHSEFWPFSIEIRQMLIIASASIFTSVLVGFCYVVLKSRQSIAGVSSQIDGKVRIISSRRIAFAALGGQLMLLGALLPSLQIFTLNFIGLDISVDSRVDLFSSVLGYGAFLAGVAVSIYAVLFPLWIRSKRAARSEFADQTN